MLIASSKSGGALLTNGKADSASIVFTGSDNASIRRLIEEADAYDMAKHGGKRLSIVLMLDSLTSLWLLQTMGIQKEVNDKVDILATTREDLLAKALLVKMPGAANAFPSLDRMPIDKNSDTTVHLVIFGFTAMAEALAINAALIAHYPNYCRDTNLRTRITIVDDVLYKTRNKFTERYAHLFENSWYRTIDLEEDSPRCVLHKPKYNNVRKDFVDIEWEFVRGDATNGALRQKLAEWSDSPRQQLTIAFCHDDDERNMDEAISLPEKVYQSATSVLCHTNEDDVLLLATRVQKFHSVIPFSEKSCDVRMLLTLRDLGQRVNYVYNHCFELGPEDPITAPSSIDKGRLEILWQKVGSLPKQYSNIFNAMTLGTKMHSLGHDEGDWKAYYALSKEEIDILTEVEHNRWSVEELILGYRPCNEDEQQLVENEVTMKKKLRQQKIHYDLRAYADLRADCTGKNVNVYDMALTQAIPLIIKSCITD